MVEFPEVDWDYYPYVYMYTPLLSSRQFHPILIEIMEGEWLLYVLSIIGRYHPCLSYITFMADERPDEYQQCQHTILIRVKADNFKHWHEKATPRYDDKYYYIIIIMLPRISYACITIIIIYLLGELQILHSAKCLNCMKQVCHFCSKELISQKFLQFWQVEYTAYDSNIKSNLTTKPIIITVFRDKQ